MALTLALATIQLATLHASHPTLHVLSPRFTFSPPRGSWRGATLYQLYNNDKSLIIIVQNTLF